MKFIDLISRFEILANVRRRKMFQLVWKADRVTGYQNVDGQGFDPSLTDFKFLAVT